MKKSLLIELSVLIGAFFIIWFALLLSKIIPENFEINLISVEQEEKIGELVFKTFFDDSDIIYEPTLDSAIAIIKNRLLSGVGQSDYEYKIYVIREKDINAFALSGGYIVIFSGLVEFTNSAEELASIISHEIGHIELKHVRDRLLKQIGITTLFLILVNNSNIITEIGKMIISTIFDRQQESDADDYSLKLMLKCKLNPHSIGHCFKRLMKEKEYHSIIPEFLNTHPSTETRIEKSLNFKIPENFIEDSLQINWERVKLSLK